MRVVYVCHARTSPLTQGLVQHPWRGLTFTSSAKLHDKFVTIHRVLRHFNAYMCQKHLNRPWTLRSIYFSNTDAWLTVADLRAQALRRLGHMRTQPRQKLLLQALRRLGHMRVQPPQKQLQAGSPFLAQTQGSIVKGKENTSQDI